MPLGTLIIRWRDGPDPTLDDTFLIPTGQVHSYPAELALNAGLESGSQDPSGRTPRYELLIGSPGRLVKASSPRDRRVTGLDRGMSGQSRSCVDSVGIRRP